MNKKVKITKGAVIYDVEGKGSSSNVKTGGWRTFKPVIDKSKCINCGTCWKFCPDNAIRPCIEVDYDFCKGCGICAKECPVKCIEMVKEEK
ncbi:4Fe-4S binding protein [Candidatus Woesearchaeota archaeon]|nr:4Fe-4S binding protein [Candidatus Woesearchaeota archaeon]